MDWKAGILSCTDFYFFLGSCRFGDENQGLCWTLFKNDTNNLSCRARFCKQGWTCTCRGRTHLCPISDRVVWRSSNKLFNNTTNWKNVTIGEESFCSKQTITAPRKPSTELGGWIGSFSETGLLENSCNEFSWWLNGETIDSFGKSPEITDENIFSELQDRSVHLLYPLKPGDLVAFRFRGASYFCQSSRYVFNVNGTTIEITNSQNDNMIRFAREFSTGWYQPWFLPQYGVDEESAEAWQFVPLRKTFFSSGSAISAGIDNYRSDDGSRDHEVTNFYFRIQL